jgi:hypothetical protein
MRYRLTLCSATAIAATAMLSVTIGADAGAQTLTNPNPPVPSRPPPAAKLDTSAHVKSCSAYGAGFVNIPGTDACVSRGLGDGGRFGQSRSLIGW